MVFIKTYPDKTIIDEVQRVPTLFSYIQTHVDKENREGMYMLAGSHNFLLMESVNQSLAGRTAILKLLPFSHVEIVNGQIVPQNIDEEIFNGGYPRLYDKHIDPVDFYPNYIQTNENQIGDPRNNNPQVAYFIAAQQYFPYTIRKEPQRQDATFWSPPLEALGTWPRRKNVA